MRSEQELIILGLLKDKPRHGYEIKKQIKDVISTFAVLDVVSIYYSLNLLEKRGFIKKSVRAAGRRPEKFIYSLTPQGEERFRQLLTKCLLTAERPNFSIDIALYFLPFLPQDVALRRLKGRIRILGMVEAALKNLARQLEGKSAFHLKSIVDHNLELLQAERRFIHKVGQELSRERISVPEWPQKS
jgi:DNA-binding PadR family transcriptional regulator